MLLTCFCILVVAVSLLLIVCGVVIYLFVKTKQIDGRMNLLGLALAHHVMNPDAHDPAAIENLKDSFNPSEEV